MKSSTRVEKNNKEVKVYMQKRIKILSLLLILALLFTACGGAKSAGGNSGTGEEQETGEVTKKSEGITELSFMGWGNEQERELYSKMLKKFEEKNPEYKVNYIYVPKDYDTKLKTMITGNTVPDVFYVGETRVPDYAKTGKLEQLDPFIESYPDLVENFVPGLLDYGKYEGKQYTIPKDWEPYMMYINKDLFKQAGIEIPTSDWTMDEFMDIARKLTVVEDNKVKQYGIGLETWWGHWSVFAGNEGGVWFKDGKANFSDPNVVKGLQRMYDLFQTYKAAPSPSALQQSGMGQSQMFETGKVAMFPSGRWMVPTFRQSVSFDWTAVEMPKGSTRVNPIFSGTLAVGKDSKDKEGAIKLLRYVLSKEGLQEIIGLGLAMPTNTAYFDDPAMVTAPPDVEPFKATSNYLDMNVQLAATQSGHFTELLDKYAQPELDAAFNGKQTIEEAVKKIDEKANAELFK
jgi:multiple sugar transport system substrate-binding protein